METESASIGTKFKKLWMYYILQSLLAAAVLFALVLVLGKDKMVTVSAMGATAFIVFAMPQSVSAQTRNVLGGHLVGLVSGGLVYLAGLPYFVSYPFVVAIAFFFMVVLDVEHAPAAATALAVLINKASPDVFLTVLVCILVMSQSRYYLRKRLKDLL